MLSVTVSLSALFALQLLLPQFAECSTYEQKRSVNASDLRTNDRHDIISKRAFDIELHGILFWASMGLLMPLGIVTMRFSSTKECSPGKHKILFYVHVILQALSVLLITIGAALSIRNFENEFNNSHQRIGLALYAAIYLQVLIGFRRPKRGTSYRSAWYLSHWILGTTVSLVGILNIYTGLQAYHNKTSRDTTLWTIVFTAQVCFVAVLYLFQDKWEYVKRRGIVHGHGGTGNDLSQQQVENQKDMMCIEPYRKSNALGTHLLRTNALNKLFQQAK